MAEQCYVYARKKWNAKYPKNKLIVDADIISGPQLWDNAAGVGYQTSSTSAVANSIVCWDDGGYGHVAWVRSVNKDGSMNISESNWPIGTGATDRNNIAFDSRGATGSFTLLGCVYP